MGSSLTRKELQQTLREMGVRVPPDATIIELEGILKRENHLRWLARGDGSGKAMERPRGTIRRRRAAKSEPPGPGADPMKEGSPVSRDLPRKGPERRRSVRTSLPSGLQNKKTRPDLSRFPIFDPKKNIDETVLRRARGVCELCDGKTAPSDLIPHFIEDARPDGEQTFKNTVALCPGCLHRIRSEPLPGDIKKLKKKGRAKLIPEVIVSSRK
jgi:hypothetical protein